jgi:signal transduction histidine kinase
MRSIMNKRAAIGYGLTAVAGVVGLLGFFVLVNDHGQSAAEAAAQILVAWTFIGAGLIAWSQRPNSRLGILLVLAGFALMARRFQYSDDSAVFTAGFGMGELWNVLIAHAVLAYPSGRLQSRFERVMVALAYVLVVAFPLATLLVYEPSQSCLYHCGEPNAPHSLLLLHADAGAFDALHDAFRITTYGVLGSILLLLIARRFLTATPSRRRTLAPMIVAGGALAVRAVIEGAITFADYSEGVRTALFWSEVVVLAAVPIALLVGLLRSRLAHAAVADLLPELQRAPAGAVRDALAGALGDPSLDVVYWLEEDRGYVDGEGRPAAPPVETPERAVAMLEQDDRLLGAIVHDPGLRDEPGLVDAAAAAARFALENARLQAELRAQLNAVRGSRARIAAAADAERRRIEQNLHDGAQQRLVALALDLRAAERRITGDPSQPVTPVLSRAVGQLQLAVDELRELAHGLHPSILRQEGLAAALDSLAGTAPLPVTVVSTVRERLTPEAEAAAYFVACEALANVAKHAQASVATVTAMRRNGKLVVEIVDDGVGGADAVHGRGLGGIRDRVEAHGGTLRVVSPPGGGTTVVGVIPCGS